MTKLPLSAIALFLGQFAVRTEAAAPYCLPGDECFPSNDVLNAFNSTVGGKLIQAIPYGAACYAATYNAEECKTLSVNKGIHAWRAAVPAAVMYTNWEQTDDMRGCPVPDPKEDGSAPDPVDGECTLGAMSSYVVNATKAEDVVATVKFAAEHNLRFRIKNTGHCYTGRSSGEGSFSIWTHYMYESAFLQDFVPSETDLPPQDVIAAGPGVNVEGLYEAGGKNGVVTIGGYTPSVGAAGGYIVGGGTGPLGAYFGLGVDNVVQYDAVMADGTQQVANEQVNPDLFWALRGGGGAFAVVTQVYIKAHPAFLAVNTVAGKVKCQGADSFQQLISNMVDLQLSVREKGQVGIWQSIPESFSLSLLSVEGFTEEPLKSANETLKPFEPIQTVEGCEPEVAASQFTGSSSWNDAYREVVVPTVEEGGAVGVSLADLSRTISYEMINDPDALEKIKEHIISSTAPVIWQNSVGEASSNVDPDETSVHPAWRNAFAFVNEPVFGEWQGISTEMMDLINETTERLDTVFGTPAYYNEQFPVGDEWQDQLFGDHYARLLEIKNKVDPKGLFNCRNCVGSEAGF